MSIKGFEVGGVQQQYDYTALDNIPANLVQDANYVHTDNNYTNADKTKLSGIEAQANKTTIDATLTHSGQAADAKATGDAISALDAQVIASMPHDTASGSIASFPDGAAMPVIDCSVAVAPNQNLNGYDNPWPAGGGKNLFPLPTTAETKNGVTVEATTNGEIWVHGTPTIASGYISFSLPQITSAITGNAATISINEKIVGIGFDSNISGGGLSLSMSDTTTVKTAVANSVVGAVLVNVRYDVGTVDKKFKIQLELGNTATAWTPFSNICPISGWTECKVTRTGKNLFDKNAPGKQEGYALDYDNGNTYQTGSGNYSASDYIPLKGGQPYVASGNSKATDYCWYDKDKAFISGGGNINSAKTAPQNASFIRIDYWRADEDSVQFELGSTASTYEAYQGQTYTIDLNGTRYGGTLDVVAGKFTANKAMFTPTQLKAGAYAAESLYYPWVDTPLTAIAFSNGLCNKLRCVTSYSDFKVNISFWVRDSYIVMNLSGTGYSTADEARAAGAAFIQDAQFCYELATPIVIDNLDPVTIETLLGTNNIFADCGDTTVSYRADTTLFVNKKIAAAVAALS